MRKKFKIQLIGFAVFSTFFVLTVFLLLPLQDAKDNTHDGRRATDILQMEVAFNRYYDENGMYPMVELGCQNMDLLKDFLDFSSTHNIMQEKYVSEGHPPYQYAVSADGEQFVVKTTFYDRQNKVDQRRLDNDLDGIILGCDCNDPNYCVGSSNLEI